MIRVSFLSQFSRIVTFCLSLRYKTFLSEDAGPDTLVAIVHANDPDGDAVSYAITGGNEDSNFLLDKQKGEEKPQQQLIKLCVCVCYIISQHALHTCTDTNANREMRTRASGDLQVFPPASVTNAEGRVTCPPLRRQTPTVTLPNVDARTNTSRQLVCCLPAADDSLNLHPLPVFVASH